MAWGGHLWLRGPPASLRDAEGDWQLGGDLGDLEESLRAGFGQLIGRVGHIVRW